jgi:MFS family permease
LVGNEAAATAARAFATVSRRPSLRRLELAWATSYLGHVSLAVGLTVYAFGVGGASAVVLVCVLRVVPAALVTPLAALLAERSHPARVMLASNGARLVVAATVTVVAGRGGGPWFVYGLCVGISLIGTPFRPARTALLPALVERPEQLAAASVVSSTIEGFGLFAGPAIAGVLLAVTDTTAVFAFCTVAFACSTLFLLRPFPRVEVDRGDHAHARSSLTRVVLAGARAIEGNSDLRVLVGLFTAQTFVDGAMAVLVVVTAIPLLRTGSPGVGWLDAAVGIGGVVGSFVAAGLAGRPRLSSSFLVGVLLWGTPLVVIAVRPSFVLAVVAFSVIGLGNILVNVAGFTLLQRAIDEALLTRVFAAFEVLSYASVAAGALVVPALDSALGARWTIAATGLLLPVLALIAGPRLRKIDRAAVAPIRAAALLHALPMFAPLPSSLLERIALHLETLVVPAGTDVIRQGEIGDRYYVLAKGAAAVFVDNVRVSLLGPGDGFGEIALLRDVPRTATVVTTEASELFALEREPFLEAVNADPRSFAAADETANRRLGLVSGTI